jgi:hypothetical protein
VRSYTAISHEPCGRSSSNSGCRFPFILGSWSIVLCCTLLFSGCGALGLGRVKGIEKTAPDEKYYILKEVYLSSGSANYSKSAFDHSLNPVINLCFTVRNEKNRYIAESRWIDPMGEEYRTIRTTHDIQQEGKRNIDRRNEALGGGTPRVHSISTQELYNHKPGMWKVVLYIDGQLARRLEFAVR